MLFDNVIRTNANINTPCPKISDTPTDKLV